MNLFRSILIAITGLLAGYPAVAQTPYRLVGDATGVTQVIAFMVEFQPDNDLLTEGDGTFNRAVSDTGYLNAGPHDSLYFASQLRFLESWWELQAGGRIDIQPYLHPTIFRLPQPMRFYSAVEQPADSGYARLIKDFSSAVNADPFVGSLPVSASTHFILFHAGLGRDINWTSILGGEPTPADIASIYLNRERIQSLAGSIPQAGNTIKIDNLSILPEVLSRTTESFGQTILLNFGIAGLMIANMGNYFGLPDLYDTETGRSRAGRFALMDGYGFFNFNGFIPSPLSTWERYQLGWETPRIYNRENLPSTIEISDLNPTPVYINLGNERFYMVERKYRYPAGSTRRVTIQTTGTGKDTAFTYPFDANGFYPYNQSDLKGVITAVDNPDWVIPAGYTAGNDTIDGGLLIWRLDDSKVRQFAASGTLSGMNNGDFPALSLMEADGSKDIGELFGDFTAGSGSETGTIFDYWYPGNIAPLYKNEFSGTSTPSSDWSFKNPTGFSITDFTRNGRDFSFKPAIDSNPAGLIGWTGKTITYPFTVSDAFWMIVGLDTLQVVVSTDSLYVYKNAVVNFSGETGKNAIVSAGGSDPDLNIWVFTDTNQLYTLTFNFGNFTRSDVIIPGGAGNGLSDPVRLPDGWGFLKQIAAGNVVPVYLKDDGTLKEYSAISENAVKVFWIADASGFVPCLFNPITGTVAPDRNGSIPVAGDFAGFFVSENHTSVAGIRENGDVLTADAGFSSINDFQSDGIAAGFTGSALVKGTDGWYRVGFSSRQVSAWEGALQLPGFPVWLPDSLEFAGLLTIGSKPLIVVSSASGTYSVPLVDGNTYMAETFNIGRANLMSGSGKLFSARVTGTSSVEYQQANADGISYGQTGSKPWKNGSFGTFNFSRRQLFAAASLPGDAYAWPNPSRDDRIHFRWLVPFSGSGSVTITDLTGDRVKKIEIQSLADAEGEVTWNCGQSEAGLYFARLELSGDGKSFSKLIKFILIR